MTKSTKFSKSEIILEAATDGIVVLDREGLYSYANAAAELILGVSRKQIMQRSYNEAKWKLTNLEGLPLSDEETPFRLVLQNNQAVYDLKCIIERHDGHKIVISTNAAPLYDETGEIDGVVGIFTDITQEYELQEQNKVFLHTVAHDLRSPLTCILGYAEFLQQSLTDSNADETTLQCVEEILKNSEKMESMIKGLVDTARIEGGSVEIKKENIHFESFVNELIQHISPKTIDTNRLLIQIPQNLPPISADPEHLERILLNLVSNAMKFSPIESKVTIRASKRTNSIKVSIADQGKGIDPEEFPRLFKRFARVGGSHTQESVGLGLYISRLLIEANNGGIWVESKVGHGSTFNFTLPIAKLGPM